MRALEKVKSYDKPRVVDRIMKKKHNYFFPEIIQISVEFLGSDYRSFKIGMPQEKNKIRQLDYDHYSNDTVSWRKQS